MISPSKPSILYVDDEENNLISFRAATRKHFVVYTATSAEAAKIVLEKETIDILVTDQKMPKTKGTELLEFVVEKYPDLVRILLTGYSDMDSLIIAVQQGHIFDYIKKPWDIANLVEVLQKAYESKLDTEKLKNEIRNKNELIESLQNKLKSIISSSKEL